MSGRTIAELLVAGMLLAGAAACQHGGGTHTHIAVEQTPPAVMEAFHRDFPGIALLHSDEIKMADGSLRYDLKFRDAQNDYHRKVFSADGKLLDTQNDVALPAAH